MNDIIVRSLSSAGIPASKKPIASLRLISQTSACSELWTFPTIWWFSRSRRSSRRSSCDRRSTSSYNRSARFSASRRPRYDSSSSNCIDAMSASKRRRSPATDSILIVNSWMCDITSASCLSVFLRARSASFNRTRTFVDSVLSVNSHIVRASVCTEDIEDRCVSRNVVSLSVASLCVTSSFLVQIIPPVN